MGERNRDDESFDRAARGEYPLRVPAVSAARPTARLTTSPSTRAPITSNRNSTSACRLSDPPTAGDVIVIDVVVGPGPGGGPRLAQVVPSRLSFTRQSYQYEQKVSIVQGACMCVRVCMHVLCLCLGQGGP